MDHTISRQFHVPRRNQPVGSPSIGRVMFTAAVLGAFCLSAAAMADGPDRVAKRNTTPAGASGSHPLAPALKIARKSLEACKQLDGYKATFSKREIVDGELQPLQVMQMKVRRKPFSVYLRFRRPHAGREVLYVDGRFDGKLLAHDSGLKGLAGTFRLLPTSERAMSESSYPITRTGMSKLVEAVIEQWEKETKYGEVDVKYYPEAKLAGRSCKVVESVHPKPRRQFKFQKTRLYLDSETNLPVRVEQFGFPKRRGAEPPLVEQFTFTNVRTDVNLTARDFDPRNPAYDF